MFLLHKQHIVGCRQSITDYKSVITMYFKFDNKFQTHQSDFMSFNPVKIPNNDWIFIANGIPSDTP